ncbi:hypothetical protein ETU08_00760 [Apibacter muscae]|uniref:hypothetical protein n=1 Tax=Apibacter muscae TaxID=2509004 RepID=UPI0011ABF487|nr:hypothetical protein [Apibacter muscae]TWP31562.1 hypothetical protein ETU08_00760 [Apibacter muscae]
MKILIDTNILINLEDNKAFSNIFPKFYRLAISNNCKIIYHLQAIPSDLKRDLNTIRKEITISKLQKYEILINYSIPSENFNKIFEVKKENDRIDNKQLF